MVNKKNTREQGVSILELLLAVSVVGVLMVLSMRWYTQFQWTRSVTLIQQNVTNLLQAANNYYYATCKQYTPTETITLDCSDLVGVGAFANVKDCRIAEFNPWGKNFAVAIVGNNDFYQLQVSGNFPRYQGRIVQLARILDASTSNTDGIELEWMVLPTTSLSHTAIAVKSSGGFAPLLNGTGLAEMPVNSAFWVMKGDLQLFTNRQVSAIDGNSSTPVTVSSCDTYKNMQ